MQSVRIPWRLRLVIRPQAQIQLQQCAIFQQLDFPKVQWFEGRDHTAPRGAVLRVFWNSSLILESGSHRPGVNL